MEEEPRIERRRKKSQEVNIERIILWSKGKGVLRRWSVVNSQRSKVK